MRSGPLATAASLLLALAGGGCAGTHRAATAGATGASTPASAQRVKSSTSPPVHAGGYDLRDGDEDSDDERPPLRFGNDDPALLVDYGGRAGPAETRTISALVKSYYAVSLAGEGARACSLVASSLRTGVEAEYGSGGRTGKEGCASAMKRMLSEQHAQLVADDVPTMRVTAVHIKGDLGLAVIEFRTTPESQIILQREAGAWRIDALFGTYMP
jgi:hypothetical protein